MSGSGLPIVDQLKTRMQWLQARQKLLAENVANADTPKFRPRDLAPLATTPAAAAAAGSGPGRLSMDVTSPAHMAGSSGSGLPGSKAASRFETRPSGNAVTLEDEMTKLADTQLDYQTVATLYAKSLSLLKIAIGKKG